MLKIINKAYLVYDKEANIYKVRECLGNRFLHLELKDYVNNFMESLNAGNEDWHSIDLKRIKSDDDKVEITFTWIIQIEVGGKEVVESFEAEW